MSLEPEFSKKARKANRIDRHGMTALMWAAAKGDVGKVRDLLDAGADVNFQKTEETFSWSKGGYPKGATALHLSVWAGEPEITQMLINKGADTNLTDEKGFSPLDVAMFKQIDVEDKLSLKRDMRVKLPMMFGRETTLSSTRIKMARISKTLLDAGAKSSFFRVEEDVKRYLKEKIGMARNLASKLKRNK